jgi:hypothetical protein
MGRPQHPHHVQSRPLASSSALAGSKNNGISHNFYHILSKFSMLCYAMLCHAMSRHAMLHSNFISFLTSYSPIFHILFFFAVQFLSLFRRCLRRLESYSNPTNVSWTHLWVCTGTKKVRFGLIVVLFCLCDMCDRFASALRSLCNCFLITFSSISHHFLIAFSSLSHRFSIDFPSLFYRIASHRNHRITTFITTFINNKKSQTGQAKITAKIARRAVAEVAAAVNHTAARDR